MEQKAVFRICGHHVFNLIWAYGMGKDHLGDETNDFRKVFHKLMDNPSTDVAIIIGVDDVCGQCKDNVDGKCQSYDGTISDKKVLEKLSLQEGTVMRWKDLVNLVAHRVKTEQDFLDIFSQETLESRYEYFKKGIEKLTSTKQEETERTR